MLGVKPVTQAHACGKPERASPALDLAEHTCAPHHLSVDESVLERLRAAEEEAARLREQLAKQEAGAQVRTGSTVELVLRAVPGPWTCARPCTARQGRVWTHPTTNKAQSLKSKGVGVLEQRGVGVAWCSWDLGRGCGPSGAHSYTRLAVLAPGSRRQPAFGGRPRLSAP